MSLLTCYRKLNKWKKAVCIFAAAFFAVVLTLVSIMVVIPLAEIHADDRPENGTNWMSLLEDGRLLSDIVIPGTHNSATERVALGFATKCQWDSIRAQLGEGFRLLDLRVKVRSTAAGEELVLVHANMECRDNGLLPPVLTLDRVLEQCYGFLQDNPTETVLLSIKQDSGGEPISKVQSLMDGYIARNQALWLLTDTVPTLGEARGKIVLLRRYEDALGLGARSGIDLHWGDQGGKTPVGLAYARNELSGNTVFVQDRYEYSLEDKWDVFHTSLQNATPGAVNISFLSTSGTGVLHPYYFAKALNQRLARTDLHAIAPQWILMDFGTGALAEHVFDVNLGTEPAWGDPFAEPQGHDLLSIVLDYFAGNFLLLVVIIVLYAVLHLHVDVGTEPTRTLSFTLWILLVLSIADHVELLFAEGSDPSIARVICSVIGYTLRPITGYSMLHMVCRDKRVHTILRGLLVVNFLVFASAFFCGIAFSYTMENGFSRGPLGYTSHTVSFIIIFVLLVYALLYVKRQNRDSLVVLLGAVSCVAAALLQTFSSHRVLNPTIAIACVFYYLYLYLHASTLDSTTHVSNRARFYEDRKRLDAGISALIVLDMDGLKKLNDTQGHLAGDQGLRTLAANFVACCGKRDYVYRVGGDEFIILCCNCEESYVRALMESIRQKNAEGPYACSMGYAMRTPEMDMDSLSRAADENMYQAKRLYYSTQGHDRRAR